MERRSHETIVSLGSQVGVTCDTDRYSDDKECDGDTPVILHNKSALTLHLLYATHSLTVILTVILTLTSHSVPLTESDLFDVASCQFALHYMFQTVERADHFFSEVSRHLVKNGLFIVTTIDCR